MSLASSTACASSSNGITATTGPKTSSRQIRRGGSSVTTTVGGTQKPSPPGVVPANATSTLVEVALHGRLLAARRSAGPSRWTRRSGRAPGAPRTAGSSRPRNSSYADRSTRIRERAQQSWPALSKTAYGALAAAAARSASANTTLALLPPSSRVTRFTCSAQPAMIRLPTSVEPVKHTLRTSGWVTNRSPTTEPLPGRTVSTCSGRPASSASSPIRIAVSGVSSAGLSTTVLPAARAGAKPQPGDRHREVPGHDDADHAERLVERDVDAAGHRDLAAEQPLRARRSSSSGSRGRCRPPSARCPTCGRRCGPRARRAPRRARRRPSRSDAAAWPARRAPRPPGAEGLVRAPRWPRRSRPGRRRDVDDRPRGGRVDDGERVGHGGLQPLEPAAQLPVGDGRP